MLKISKDNVQFALANNIQIPWVFRSPLLVSDYSSRTGPFELDAKSQVNQFLLNYPNRLSKVTQSNTNIEVTLEMNSFKKNVLLKLQHSDNNKISGLILFDNGRFFNLVKGKSLTDFDFGSSFLGNTDQEIGIHLDSISNKVYPNIDYCFPTLATPNVFGHENELNPIFKGLANFYDEDTKYFFNHSLISSPEASNEYTFVPCIYIFALLDKLFKLTGYSFDSVKQFGNTDLMSLCLISNSTLDMNLPAYSASIEAEDVVIGSHDRENYTLIPLKQVLQDGIYNNNSFIDIPNSNITIKETGTHIIKFDFDYLLPEDHFWPYPPYMHIAIFIDGNRIESTVQQWEFKVYDAIDSHSFELSLYCSGADIGKSLQIKAVNVENVSFYMGEVSFSNATIEINNISAETLNRCNTDLIYNDHIPNISISNFISVIENITCSVFSFNDNDRSVSIHFWKDILEDIQYNDDLGNIVKDSIKVNYIDLVRSLSLEFENSHSIDLSSYNRLPDTNSPPLDENGSLNDIILCINANAFYIFSIPEKENEEDPDPLPTWIYLCSNNYKFNYNTDSTSTSKKVIAASLPKMVWEGTREVSSDNALMPIIPNCHSVLLPDTQVSDELNLVFYKGIQLDRENFYYPFATPLNTTSKGIKVGDISLNPIDVIDEFYLAYLKWILRRYPIELKSYVSLNLLKNIAYARKHRLNGINFLIESIEVAMTSHTLTEANIRLFST